MINERRRQTDQERFRNFSLVTYCTEEQIQEVITKHYENIKAYAYICHDKDNKLPHHHIIIALKNATTNDAIRKWFKGYKDNKNELINTLSQPIENKIKAYEYLIHKNDKTKFQYEEEEIKAKNIEYFIGKSDDTDKQYEMLQMLLDGRNPLEIAKMYGKDFIYHYQQIRELAIDIRIYQVDNTSIFTRNNKEIEE